MTHVQTKTLKIGSSEIHLETGRIAKQAHGAVIVRHNETVVLVAVTTAVETGETLDFFPLTVEYRERAAAGGLIPGGYTRRETRAADHEILNARIIDRSIRPLFPKSYRKETQVIATVLSADASADPGLLSLIGASAALQISEIPWNGPLLGVRVALKDDGYSLLPSLRELDQYRLNLIVSLSSDGLVMVEGGAREISESELIEALVFVEQALAGPLAELEQWCRSLCPGKRPVEPEQPNQELIDALRSRFEPELRTLFGQDLTKKERYARLDQIMTDLIKHFSSDEPERAPVIRQLLEEMAHDLFRTLTIERQIRLDGRTFQEIRPISIEMGWLPRVHGSTVFTRGETQALVSCSLGTSRDEQLVETMFGLEKKRFMLHYNFPPFSVGEIRALRGPGRREIGHGALAARALEHMLPDYEDFPYTIRIVSDITESNGSSSMASVCGGCCALYDAGVPLERPIAGIAMGLIKQNERIAILSDILGDEDHYGDMDFKIAGTDRGITAVQMDNKLGSLERTVLEQALEQARTGRLHILELMTAAIGQKPRELNPRAPRVLTHMIKTSRIRDLIGPGGKIIQELQLQTRTKIEVDESGLVRIYAEGLESAHEALKQVKYLTDDIEIGKVYKGEVTSVKNFGAFVKISPQAEGLVHISELDTNHVADIEDFVKEGETMIVRVLGVDNRGKIKLSRKAALDSTPEE
ncbi:polyribonucleotide nucleotidyltransferase [bacterium]|nr:polyribonucleotide nucleotidyltransferase [bacterium]